MKFENKQVEAVFRAYSIEILEKLLHLRHLIFATAAGTPHVGNVEETLK